MVYSDVCDYWDMNQQIHQLNSEQQVLFYEPACRCIVATYRTGVQLLTVREKNNNYISSVIPVTLR